MTQRSTLIGGNFSAFSTNPNQLQEINLDSEFNMSCHSLSKASPNQMRTMKDYEEQLGSLRKENFNLKLKVYFLEERLDNKPYVNSQSELFKKNIELEVKLESFKKEMNEQQELICEAARALEALEAAAANKENELNLQINSLQEEINTLRENANVQSVKIEENSINLDINDASGVIGADDSVALYTAAFNITRPTASENLQKNLFKPNSCECRKLRALLATELETVSSLRNSISTRDKEVLHLQQQIQELNEKIKIFESEKLQVLERKQDIIENVEKEQLDKLKQENINACQMIQNCLIRIKQVDRENRKLKQNLQEKETILEQSQGKYLNNNQATLVQKYKNMLDERDSRIFELENELKSKNSSKDDKEWNWMNSHLSEKINTLRESIFFDNKIKEEPTDLKDNNQKDLLHILTSRLQEMAYFLDSLLSNRCIIGEEKCKKVENLLEQSLELPIGLKLDPMASQMLEDSYADLTLNNLSHSIKLADLTKLFGHHVALDDTIGSNKPIEYKLLNKNEENNNVEMQLQIKDEEIERLKVQLQYQNERCICKSVEDSDSKTELDLRFNPSEHNRLLLKKNRSKSNRFNKFNINTTWHGQEFQIDQSESECWSEPDRSVSLARMGGPLEVNTKDYVSSEEEACTCRKHSYSRQNQTHTDESRLSHSCNQIKLLMEEKLEIQKMLDEANVKILSLENFIETNKHQYILNLNQNQDEINKLNKKLKNAEEALEKYIVKHKEMTEHLVTERNAIEQKLLKLESHAHEMEKIILVEQQQQKKLENELKEMSFACDHKIKEMKDKIETDWVSRVRYEALRRELDNAVLQASQATLDRNLATEQKTRSDSEAERLKRSLSETKIKVNELENKNNELQSRLDNVNTWQNPQNNILAFPTHESNSPQRATSPDQGIDSDRLSSLEIIAPTAMRDDHETPDLAAENAALRKKLEWTKRMLEDTQNKLNTINYRKKKEQRAMCQEIHKTQSVLRQVRDNLSLDS